MRAAKKRVRGIEVAYEERGRGSAIVLLHGFPFNRSMWRDQMEALSVKHRVIAPDLRGHGETPVTGSATMEEMAEDVAVLMDSLDIERAVIGGLSMGGYVAFAFTRLHPERVRALVLADTRAQADTEEARRNREAMANRALQEGMEAIAEAQMPKLLVPKTLREEPEKVARVREMIVGTNPEGAAAALRGMKARRDQSDLLPRLNVPTLIIVGSEDQLTPPTDAEIMHHEIRGSRLEIIKGTGHISNVECPEEFNHAFVSFLDTIEP